jgi:hypothetical protein
VTDHLRRSPTHDTRDRFVVPAGRAALLALVAGPLWVLYGSFTMLSPWGTDVVYREALGYSAVVDVPLFLLYNLPGALALILSAVALLGVIALLPRDPGGSGKAASRLAYAALGLGLLSLGGVVVRFDPVFTAGRIFGTLSLGLATLGASLAARRAPVASTWTWALLWLGVLGVFLLPLWPLVYALGWLTEAAAASVIALFGIGWMWIGLRLWNEAGRPQPSTSRDP